MAVWPGTVNPSYSLVKTPIFSTLIIPYANGREQRIAKNSNPKYRFLLKWNVLSSSEIDTIRSFFIARYGNVETFTWTNPEDSADYTVRFDDSVINFDYFSNNLYNLKQVSFIQV